MDQARAGGGSPGHRMESSEKSVSSGHSMQELPDFSVDSSPTTSKSTRDDSFS
jgi:hypothetical protein